MKTFIYFLTFLTCASILWAEDDICALTRSDNLPKEVLEGASDSYFEGYIQALVDLHYYEYQVVVIVKDKVVWLANLPKNELLAKSIKSFVKDVPGVKEVKILDGIPPKEMAEREKYVDRPHVKGIWFPQNTELFLPLIADPRQVINSIGYRGGDKVIGKKAVAVSLGADFPIFRWLEVLPWKGDLQISIESGIWSVFNLDPKPNYNGGTALVNTDFYVAIPLSYAVNKWSFRFRIYHLSSHLGDEFLVDHPGYHRVNPSYEAVDFFFSYQANDILRLYGGPGLILHSDKSFDMDHAYVEYGTEARFAGSKFDYHKLYGTFFAAIHFRNWQMDHWYFDGTYALGYEWSNLKNVGRRIRLFAEAHHGYSLEGQFMKDKTSYGSIKLAYGF
ncbi:MAG: DUF1207 domain-containing protein [Parachlamydiales bacterium]|nr:DUF1207 domain-containing protein [Parachlamydiales bacterium]